MGYIYKIENNFDNNIYIGQTTNTVEYRWQQHKYNYKTRNTHLYLAMRKYGIHNFSINCLEECDDTLLNQRETYWIKYYDSFENGYNMNYGGDNQSTLLESQIKSIISLWQEGKSIGIISKITKHSPDCIQRKLIKHNLYDMKESKRRGREESKITKQKKVYIFDLCGMLLDITTIEQLSLKYKLTNREVRRKCREHLIYQELLFLYEEEQENIKQILYNKKIIYQYDIKLNFINAYSTIAEAKRKTNINNIGKVLSKKCKTAGGYYWLYNFEDIILLESYAKSHGINGKRLVAQYDLNNNFITTYGSIIEAAKATNQKTSSNITQVCKGNLQSAGGYKWRYIDG